MFVSLDNNSETSLLRASRVYGHTKLLRLDRLYCKSDRTFHWDA